MGMDNPMVWEEVKEEVAAEVNETADEETEDAE